MYQELDFYGLHSMDSVRAKSYSCHPAIRVSSQNLYTGKWEVLIKGEQLIKIIDVIRHWQSA